jgi:hypothetical protein
MKVQNHVVLGDDDHVVVLGTVNVTAPSGKSAEYNSRSSTSRRQDHRGQGLAENDAVTDPSGTSWRNTLRS